MSSNGCSVCNEPGHHPSRCPTLSAPLQPGFFKPSGGYRASDEDEDEHCKVNLMPIPPVFPFKYLKRSCQLKTFKSVKL